MSSLFLLKKFGDIFLNFLIDFMRNRNMLTFFLLFFPFEFLLHKILIDKIHFTHGLKEFFFCIEFDWSFLEFKNGTRQKSMSLSYMLSFNFRIKLESGICL